MLRKTLTAVGLIALTAAVASGAAAYTGSLTSPVASGIDGTGFWVTPPDQTTITWTVTPVTGGWDYHYKLEVPRAAISHWIIETSTNFTANDISGLQVNQGSVQSYSVGLFQAPPPGNPGQQPNPFMPADVYGIKFDGTTGTTVELSFFSPRAPVWGDFYAKCGNVGGTQNTAWNAGFAAADPGDPPADGSVAFHILVPDTVVPEPSSMAVLAMGIPAALLGLRRRR